MALDHSGNAVLCDVPGVFRSVLEKQQKMRSARSRSRGSSPPAERWTTKRQTRSWRVMSGALVALALVPAAGAQNEATLPVRGLCVKAPAPDRVDDFLRFVREDLAPAGVNTLVLRVDYNYEFEEHPELRDAEALSKGDVHRLVTASRETGIRIIPQVNLLGHQSWEERAGKLLEVYPEFDETPWVLLPEKYVWPNPDRLYCKSYCPLHPRVHDVVFSVVDEICDAFEADAFHAGMDEVFYIGEYGCPRCAGRDKAELFAGEVRAIHDHLAARGRGLWIWGDRLLDGRTTGLGEWEASYNNTHRAVDLIPTDVVICDWHYERPEPTPAYFAMKGFPVVACPWKEAGSAVQQVRDMRRFRGHATPEMKGRYLGLLQTAWGEAGDFIDAFRGDAEPEGERKDEAACFKAVLQELQAKPDR
jgi:hypothetical protein